MVIIRGVHRRGHDFFKLFRNYFKPHQRVERSEKHTHTNFQDNRSYFSTRMSTHFVEFRGPVVRKSENSKFQKIGEMG